MSISDSNRYKTEKDAPYSNVVALFPESLLLDGALTIVGVNPYIARVLGYSDTELCGQSVFILVGTDKQHERIQDLRHKTYFELTLVLNTGNRTSVECRVSGAPLGSIGSHDTMLLLKIRPVDEKELLQAHLEASRNELDEFIYRAAHDLRGPLASLRGLINLLKMQTADQDTNRLLTMMDACSEQMDNRLFNLHYLSESIPAKTLSQTLDCASLESLLRSTIEENAPIDAIDFLFTSSLPEVRGLNSELLSSMLNQLVLCLLSLERDANNRIRITLANTDTGVAIAVFSKGFNWTYQMREAFHKETPLFTNIVTYTNLINFYSAQKVGRRINAVLDVDFVSEDAQLISIFVPFIRYR